MTRKKVYRYATIANLNSEGEEARQAILYGVLQGRLQEKYNDLGEWINDYSQLKDTGWGNSGTGVKHRNYIIWSHDKLFTDYNRDDLYAQDDGTYERDPCTFANLSQVVNPTISMDLSLEDEQTTSVVEDYLNLDLDDEDLTNQTITVTGILEDGTLVPDIQVTVNIHRTWKAVVKTQYVGAYNVQYLGEAYIYDHGEEYVESNEWFRYGLVSGNDFVEVSAGDDHSDVDEGLDETEEGTEIDAGGDSDHAWLYWGYNTTEVHIDEQNNNEEVTTEEFNAEEDEYIALYDWIDTKISDWDETTILFVLAGYIQPTDYITGYASLNGYILVEQNGDTYEPVEEEGNEIPLTYTYEFELEDYQKTYTETYETTSELENYKFFSIVVKNSDAVNDSTLGSLTEDIQNVELDMSPPIAIKRKTGTYENWVTEDVDRKWYWRNWRACKQEIGDEDYFDEVFESLQDSITDSIIKCVYLMYGLPINMCQLQYCAHYAIQFFKMLCVSDWQSIERGQDYTYTCGNRSWEFNANAHAYHFAWGFSSMTYVSGSGDCPAYSAADEDTRFYPGAGGCVKYNDKYTIWRQHTADTWEYVQVSGYYNEFRRIKDGKSYKITSNDDDNSWLTDMWEVENVERQYSKCCIPLSRIVFKKISIANFTDNIQYCRLVGATGYKVVRKKWYQTGLFQFILIIIIIIINVVVYVFCTAAGPYVSAASAGVLGTAYALLWSIIIKVAVSLAIGVLMQLVIAPILTSLFGDLIGQILTTVAQIYCTAGVFGFLGTGATGSFSFTNAINSALSSLGDPTTWMDLVNGCVEAYYKYASNQNAKKLESLANQKEQVTENSEEINKEQKETWYETTGQTSLLAKVTGRNIIESHLPSEEYPPTIESPERFFQRTLLCASDMADISHDVLENFCDYSLDTQPSAILA